ncbi:hypothetical protein HPB49_000310 [Dermacentor silvarum]|uniref:Uncharacterized protein n=1 Tax=Dermacentor silvarum TaxID=543639 RepID=A0ACB8CU54_DERSI|nr:hypothetical protein HPB49_000310 [Dermacentor silvarum]
MSCKGVATGIDSETHPDELMANLRAPQAAILFARMLGKSTAALITFDWAGSSKNTLLLWWRTPMSTLPTAISGMQHMPENRAQGGHLSHAGECPVQELQTRKPIGGLPMPTEVCALWRRSPSYTPKLSSQAAASPSTNHTSYVTPATPGTPTTFSPPPTLGLAPVNHKLPGQKRRQLPRR